MTLTYFLIQTILDLILTFSDSTIGDFPSNTNLDTNPVDVSPRLTPPRTLNVPAIRISVRDISRYMDFVAAER